MKYSLRDNHLIMIGDTHSIRAATILLHRCPIGSTVLYMGDLGIGFASKEFDTRSIQLMGEVAASRNLDVYVIRGNHDGPEWWPYHVNNHLQLCGDYDYLVFPNGKQGIVVGGGFSVDRSVRVDGKDYWSKGELTEFKPELIEESYFAFYHDAPSYFNHPTESLSTGPFKWLVEKDPTLVEDAHPQRIVMDKITELAKPKRIYGGHFHNSFDEEKDGVRYRCLNCNEVIDLDTNRLE